MCAYNMEMIKAMFVDQLLAEGRRFLDTLKDPGIVKIGRRQSTFGGASHFRIKAAFWWYFSKSDEWRLVVATPLVDEMGPLATYKDIQITLSWHRELRLSLQSISVVSAKDDRVRAFNKAMKISPDPDGVRFTRSALNGTYIEDAYVYRLR